uniref:Hepcidin n=1 Tax=Varanus komodoensis TaxID=61221 RepID=A0A8D2J1L3_VARKO
WAGSQEVWALVLTQLWSFLAGFQREGLLHEAGRHVSLGPCQSRLHFPPQVPLQRSKRSSHLAICTFCCGCCRQKGCGFCCRS